MFIVRVTFESSNRQYCYLCPYTNVKVGDKVIVESPYNGYTAVTVVKIHNLGDKEAGTPTKYVVNTIDDREYRERKEARERLAEIQKAFDSAAEARERAHNAAKEAEKAEKRARELAAKAGAKTVTVRQVDGVSVHNLLSHLTGQGRLRLDPSEY